MRTCNEIRSLMADWLDDELSVTLAARVEEHLAHCDECRTAFTQLESLGDELSLLGHVADRIAEQPASANQKNVPRRMPWLRAAAVVLLVSGGWYFARTMYVPQSRAIVDRTPVKQLSDIPVAPARPDATLEKNLHVEGHTAVAMATANPRVRIVWLYQDAATPAGSTHSSGGAKPRPQG